MKIGMRLAMGFGLLVVVMAAIGVISYTNVSSLNEQIDGVVNDKYPKYVKVNEIIDAANEIARVIRNMVITNDAKELESQYERYQNIQSTMGEKYKWLEERITSEEGKKLLNNLMESRAQYVPNHKKCSELAHAGKKDEAIALLFGDLRETQRLFFVDLNKLIDFQDKLMKESGKEAADMASSTQTLIIILIIVGIILAVIVAFFVTRSITKPVAEVVDSANKIAKGDMSAKLDSSSKDEIGVLVQAMKNMSNNIKAMVGDVNMLAQAATDGKLDTRADANRHQGEYKNLIVGFNSTLDNVIGPLNVAAEYVDRISKGDIPPKITDTYKGDFNEIKNNLNQCIDAVTLLVKDAGMLAQAAIDGKLDTRADASRHQGDFRAIVDGVNKTLDNVIGPLNVAAEYVDRISKGDIPPKITDNYNGDFNEIKNNLNQCIDAVALLVKDAAMLANAAVEGKLDTRADATRHQGDFRAIVEGVNKTLDNVIGPLNVAAEYVDRISKGDLPPIITDNYNGDFNEIKNNLNTLIDAMKNVTNIAVEISKGNLNNEIKMRSGEDKLMQALQIMTNSINAVTADTLMLAESATNGKLTLRGDASKHQGEYFRIITGINNTLDALASIVNLSTNLMIADKDGVITFTNKAVEKLLSEQERAIQQTFPGFSSKNLIGKNIDEFHRNPSHNKQIMKNLSDKPHQAMINLGDQIFKLTINALNDKQGNRLGYVVEWNNYTAEANFEQSLQNIITDMTDGKLKNRMRIDNLAGRYLDIAGNINKMLNGIINPLNVAAKYVDEISKGQIPAKITDHYEGDFNEIKNNLNQCIDAVQGLVSDALMLANAAVEGKLSTRADASKHHGEFKRIVEGVNKTLDEVINPINEAAKVLGKMAEGNLSIKMTGEFKGDHAALKKAINTTVELMPFKEAVSCLKAMAEGDLTKKMQRDYKGDALVMKNAVNDTIESISEILSQVRVTVDEVTRGAMQVSDASTALSQGATQQAASLEEITSSMAEIGSQTKMNAENANQANLLTIEAKDAADKGNREMEQLNKAMTEITDSSRNISKIIKVIDEIAFQTNLLALNAAVEAARAGRHGKGFAVVAEEVRNLAARSATAAKETSELIENSIKTVENGSNLAARTGEALQEIRSGSIKAADIVGEIATSSNEQAQGISQINEGLAQIDKVTQTNTASAEESASAAEELSGQANQLKQLIMRFKLNSDIHGSYGGDYHSTMMVSAKRQQRSLPTASSHMDDYNDDHMEDNPEDIIKLDEDNFGRY